MKNINKSSLLSLIKNSSSWILKVTTTFLAILSFQSCEDTYLDVVPDNVATLDKAFALKNEAEKVLFTCYSFMPNNGDVVHNIAMLSGDELWIPPQDMAITSYGFKIAQGFQRTSDTYLDAWEGRFQGAGVADRYPLFDGIRTCNVLISNLEDMNQVPDMDLPTRQRWIAEGKFLKAYYLYYLARMYGPIPVMRQNVPIDADESELYVKREPVDQVFEYVVSLLDEAFEKLPTLISDNINEYGRATKTMAKALKAEVLLTAASPLFNGNSDMASFVTADGVPFFNPNESVEKWQLAADAALDAINQAHSSGHSLYEFATASGSISDISRQKLSIRNAVTERGNTEVLWANTVNPVYWMQRQSMVPLDADTPDYMAMKILSPTFKIANQFYSKNGVPIDEDNTLDFSNFDEVLIAQSTDSLNIVEGYQTARINFDREPRFYANLGFDGSIFYLESSLTSGNETLHHIESKYDQYAGSNDIFNFNVTGYYLKKLVNYKFSVERSTYHVYAWPEMRLAELYLDYAEALNEVEGPTPEVFKYVDMVRERAGLAGVKESWDTFIDNPKWNHEDKAGMREIIHRERTIELAFEGKRYWDLRRWKKANIELNKPIQGWNVLGKENASYYQINTLYQQRFVHPRDYFWPLNEYSILRNPNLIQNPGW